MAILNFILLIINCFFIFILTKDYSDKYQALIPCLIMLGWLFFPQSYAGNILPSLLIIFAAIWIFFKYYEKFELRKLVPIAIATSLVVFIRFDIASFLYGMFFWAMFWAGMVDVEGLHLTLKKRAIRGFLQGLFFTLIVIMACLPALIYFGSINGFATTLQQLFHNLLAIFQTNEEKYSFKLISFIHNCVFNPSFYNILKIIVFLFPLIICIISIYFFYSNHKKNIEKANTPIFWKKMLIFNLAANFYTQAIIRADWEGLFPAFIAASMLIPHVLIQPLIRHSTTK